MQRTDRQICYINIERQCADARKKIQDGGRLPFQKSFFGRN